VGPEEFSTKDSRTIAPDASLENASEEQVLLAAHPFPVALSGAEPVYGEDEGPVRSTFPPAG